MSTVAIIPAKGHSNRLKNKNKRWVGERPMISYSIRDALDCPLIKDAYVSTDDPEIAEIAEKWGAKVPVLRPPELAKSTSSLISALKHMAVWLDENDKRPDIVVLLKATVLFREENIVTRVVQTLLENPLIDTCVAALITNSVLGRRSELPDVSPKYIQPDIRSNDPRRSGKRDEWYQEDPGVACASRFPVILEGIHYVSDKKDIVLHDDKRSRIDIDDIYDLWLAEKVATEWNPVRDLAPLDLEDALFYGSD